MKLHLPHKLRAAVLTALSVLPCFVPTVATGVFGCGVATWSLALLAAPQVHAGTLTTATSEYNGTTYSGTVFTYNAADKAGTQTLHNAVLSYGDADGNFDCANAQTVDGVESTSGWHVFVNKSDYTSSYGQTLRLTGATADIFLESQFSPYTLGGLITDATDAGDYTYTVGRSSGNCNIQFLANAASGFNMDIGSNTVVQASGNGFNIDVKTGGTWNIAQGKTLTLTSAAAINIESGVAVSITGGGTVHFNGAMTNNGTITLEEGATLDWAEHYSDGDTMTVGTLYGFDNSVANLGGRQHATYNSSEGTITISGVRASLQWNSGNGEWGADSGEVWTYTTTGETYSFSDLDDVAFNGTAENKLVVTQRDTQRVNDMDLQNTELTVSGNLTANSVDVSGGATVTVNEGANFSADTVAITAGTGNSLTMALSQDTAIGTLTMGNNTALTVSGAGHTLTIGTQAGNLGYMGSGVEISSNGQTRTLNAGAGATLRDNRYLRLNGGTLHVGGGGTVEVFGISLSSNGAFVTTVDIAAGTTMHIFGTSHDTTAGNKAAFSLSHYNAANRLNVSGTLISDAAIVSIAQTSASLNVKAGGKLVMTNGLLGYRRDTNAKSTINIESGGTLSVGSADANSSAALTVNMAAGSTIEAYDGEGGNNTDGNSIVGQTLALGTGEGAVNFSAAAGKTLTIKALTGDRGINIKGAGTVALEGLTLTNALSVEAGSTLSLKGNVTIGKTIDSAGTVSLAEGGQLTLADVTGLEVSGEVTYSDAVSHSEQNGYANASYIVVKGSGTVTNLNQVTLYGGGHALTESGGNRVVTLRGTAGLYYVREGTVEYGGTDENANNAASADTTGIVLDGGSLTMQQNLAERVNITLSAAGTVSLGQNVTLSGDRVIRNGHKLTLGGTGKYVHQSAVGDFSLSNYGFSSDWDGTVELQAKTSLMNLSADTPASYKGTMILNFGNHIVIGKNASTTNSIFGEETRLVLNAGTADHAMILNSQYAGENNALVLASLSSGVDSEGDYVVSYIRGDYHNGTTFRYLKIVGNDSTTFAGSFMDNSNRSVGLIKEGTGNLTLTGASDSTAKLKVDGGTLTFADNGSWAGNIDIGADGTLAFAGGNKTLSQGGTIANGAHIKTLDGVTLTLTKAIANNSAPVFNIAEGTTLKVNGSGTLGGSKFEGAGTLRFEKAGDIRSTGNTFTGTLDIASGLFSLGAIGTGESYGRGNADLDATKVLVHGGATFQTNNGQNDKPTDFDNMGATIESTFYAQHGSTLKNMDGYSKWSGTIHLNVSDVTNLSDPVNPECNAGGTTTMHIHWAKYVVWDALVEGNGTLNIVGGNWDRGNAHRLVLNNDSNGFSGTYCLEGKTSNVADEGTFKMELYLNKANAARNAIINIDASAAAETGMTNLLVGVDATIAGLKGTAKGAVKADGGARTLTIDQSTDTEFAGVIANGDTEAEVLGITKQNTGTLTLSGENTYTGSTTVTGGTLKVTGTIGNTSSVAVSGDGALEISADNGASVTVGSITATANSAEGGTAKKVTINSRGISGTTTTNEEGGTLQELGELSGMTLAFAAENTAAAISHVTMRDVTLNATTTGTVTYGDNVKAEAATAMPPTLLPTRLKL